MTKSKVLPPQITDTIWMRIEELYHNGLNDYVISDRLDIKISKVRAWRNKYNLPANKAMKASGKFDYGRVKELYDAGLNDTEISNITDIPYGKILQWRSYNNLTPNCQLVGNAKQMDETLLLKLYNLNLSDPYIAKICGVGLTSISNWREANKLSPIPCKQGRRALSELDKIPLHKVFDGESLYFNGDFIKKFVSGEITNA